MKIPAIRAKIGTWYYYISSLTFEQVKEHVSAIDDELHKSTVLREMLQRSITTNYKKIATYIEQQDERFFNSLVLAVYDGDPLWHEVRLSFDEEEEYYDMGFLELTGDEKIFPIDGQHRVEGIKEALSKGEQYSEERIPVLFVGHKKDDLGMQRARRLFSTLNRYAKPVSKRDIIVLDEDDCVAITTRNLIESFPLFEDERILDIKGKPIPESNTKAFTTIITFYECNYELLHYYLRDLEVRDPDGKKVKGKSKAKEFIRFRPDDESLCAYEKLCQKFWKQLSSEVSEVKEYLKTEPDALPYRNKEGGSLLFRPVALIPFVQSVLLIKEKTNTDFKTIFKQFNKVNLKIESAEWSGVLWDGNNHKMIMSKQKTVELLLVYYFDKSLLAEEEKEKLIKEYASALQITPAKAKRKLF